MTEGPARGRRVGILHPGAMGVSLAAAAAEIYHRLAGFKDSNQPPDVDEVIHALLPDVLGQPDA